MCAAQGVDRSYATAFNLREHQKISHQNLEYTCPKCSKRYKSQKAYGAHIRKCAEKADSLNEPVAKRQALGEFVTDQGGDGIVLGGLPFGLGAPPILTNPVSSTDLLMMPNNLYLPGP